jgi:hypothetical protein
MFSKGFVKVAYTESRMTPRDYYDLKHEKDPYQGAVLGALAGAAVGGAKHKNHKAALIGAGIGGATGLSGGYLTGKASKAIRLSLLNNEIKNLNLKSSPSRHQKGE